MGQFLLQIIKQLLETICKTCGSQCSTRDAESVGDYSYIKIRDHILCNYKELTDTIVGTDEASPKSKDKCSEREHHKQDSATTDQRCCLEVDYFLHLREMGCNRSRGSLNYEIGANFMSAISKNYNIKLSHALKNQ